MSQLEMSFCGIDVSAATLAVAVQQEGGELCEREFANTAVGHRSLIAWLGRRGPARVALGATGIYSMDLALALNAAADIEVEVLNPKKAHHFSGTLRRSKTDRADAWALSEYCRRMEFTPWHAPDPTQLQLRSLCRHIAGLTGELQRSKNRLHAARSSSTTPACVVEDLKLSQIELKRRIVTLRQQAMKLVQADRSLLDRFDLLVSIPGIARVSALQLLGELTLLSADMPVREWVAHSGLDPAHQTSGTSVHRASRISRAGNQHLRRALFMPALVAIRHDAHMKAFYDALLARHKAKMQAIITVVRKILHAVYGILKTKTAYDGQKLFPALIPA